MEESTSASTSAQRSAPFLDYLDRWQTSLHTLNFQNDGVDPRNVAIASIDLINGFCYEGVLSSPRVAAIVAPIVRLFSRAYDLGVGHFILIQEEHSPDALEFGSFARHCVRGTHEAQTVDALTALPFSGEFVHFAKNSIHPALGNSFNWWLDAHPEVTTYIVVGDCTDLCVYQLAMHLKLTANEHDVKRRVIVPANAVDTYDLPVATAQSLGIMAHDADLLHTVFLYHMALNGIEIVSAVV